MLHKSTFSLCLLFCFNSAWASCTLATSGFTQGVATHFGFLNRPLTQLDAMRPAGFTSLRDEVFWRHVEDSAGHLRIPAHVDDYVNQALQRGIKPMLVLGYGHPNYNAGNKPNTPESRAGWRRYAQFVVQHFKGRVQTYELWNEWDIAIGGTQAGQPEDYAKLINEVAPALHRIDPSLCLIAGAVTHDALENGWLFKAIRSGLLNNVDALSIHTYNYYRKRFNKNTPEAWSDEMKNFVQPRNQNGQGQPIPLFITEMGWPSDTGPMGITTQQQSGYAQRLFLLAQTVPNLAGVWWYGWEDEGDNPQESEHRFGLVDRKGQKKLALNALEEQAALLQNMHWQETLQSTPRMVLRFATNTQKPTAETLALWRTDTVSESFTLVPEYSNSAVQFSVNCAATLTPRGWQVTVDQRPCLSKISGKWKFTMDKSTR